MKLSIILMAILVTIQGAEISEEWKPIEESIFKRIITPEDGVIERDIKSLFAQYILLAAMERANASESSVSTTESIRPVEYGKTFQPAPQQAVVAPSPQIIYVYVTAPTAAPQRVDNIKTKKPTKPPRTKKPKPPRHHEAQAPVVQQQPIYVPQPIYIQVPQQQQVVQQQVVPVKQAEDTPQESIVASEGSEPSRPQVVATSAPVTQPAPTAPPQQVIVIQQQPPPPQPTAAATIAPILTPAPGAASVAPAAVTAPTIPAVTVTPRPRPSQEHVLNQVDKILQSVSRGNITGIVDQSLQINTSMPVRNLVNGILNTIFCTPINRLFNRCRG